MRCLASSIDRFNRSSNSIYQPSALQTQKAARHVLAMQSASAIGLGLSILSMASSKPPASLQLLFRGRAAAARQAP